MSDHPIHDESMQEIVESFVVEATEVYDGLEGDILELERNPNDEELVDQIFRDVHTVKGTASFLNLKQLSTLSHDFEDVLGKLRDGEVEFDPDMTDVLLCAYDHMELLTQQVIDRDLQPVDISGLTEALEAISEGRFDPSEVDLPDASNPTEPSPEESPEPSSAPQDSSAHSADEVSAEELSRNTASAEPRAEEDSSQEGADQKDARQKSSDQDGSSGGTVGEDSVAEDAAEKALEGGASARSSNSGSSSSSSSRGSTSNGGSSSRGGSAPDTIRVEVERLDRLMDLVGELVLGRNRLLQLASEAQSHGSSVAIGSDEETGSGAISDGRSAISGDGAPDGSFAENGSPTETPGDSGARDGSVDHSVSPNNRSPGDAGALSDLTENGKSSRGEGLKARLKEVADKIDYTTGKLQNAVMQTRMVEISQVFNRFPRVVRDLSREFGKEIDLVIEGEETELDKSLVEEIGDPILHLVRNAADHGIEMPEKRKEKGKDPRGEIRLSASHAGNHIVIEVEDDGGGLDPDAIKSKALENGVITEEEAEDLSAEEAHELIFRPGFSTTEEVSSVSGRGVGMDVVKTSIAELNGSIEIDSTQGEGTRFQIKLPLTLAILQSMLTRCGEEIFAIPLYAVEEAIRLEPGKIETMHGGEVIEHRDRVLPVVRLGEALGVPSSERTGPDAAGAPTGDDHSGGDGADDADLEAARRSHALIVSSSHREVALVVDRLLAQEEVVIKSLGEYLRSVPGVAGSTILGDGKVAMVLDVSDLLRTAVQSRAEGAEAQLDSAPKAEVAL